MGRILLPKSPKKDEVEERSSLCAERGFASLPAKTGVNGVRTVRSVVGTDRGPLLDRPCVRPWLSE